MVEILRAWNYLRTETVPVRLGCPSSVGNNICTETVGLFNCEDITGRAKFYTLIDYSYAILAHRLYRVILYDVSARCMGSGFSHWNSQK